MSAIPQNAGVGKREAKPPLVWLDVPFEQNAHAKALGARWSRKRKRWYVPRGVERAPFERWVPGPGADHESDPVGAFAAFLGSNGARFDGPPVMDGHWHRAALESDAGGKRSASYRGFLDGRPNGQLMNFKTGERADWLGRTKAIGGTARMALLEEAARRRAEREAQRVARHEAAARRAAKIWLKAEPLPADSSAGARHPYLAAKRVGAHGARLSAAGHLLIPVADLSGHLWSLLVIGADGAKRFLKGGRKAGLMHVIDPSNGFERGPVLIAEGYATAATVHEATGLPAVAAFDAGNLEPVAVAIREHCPQGLIVIAGDDDHRLDKTLGGNTGRIHAEGAGAAVDGAVALPPFSAAQRAAGLTDWNDLCAAEGLEAVRRALQGAVKKDA